MIIVLSVLHNDTNTQIHTYVQALTADSWKSEEIHNKAKEREGEIWGPDLEVVDVSRPFFLVTVSN